MTTSLDKFSLEFVNFCYPSMKIFEGGAAFGIATREILKRGCHVYVNDLLKEHLDCISDACSKEEKERLFLFPGPIQNLSFEKVFFDGIFSSRMIHLLKGEDIEKTLHHFFSWLRPLGKLILTADTPFLKCYASHIKQYEHQRKQGNKWPGLIENTVPFKNITFNNIPEFINFLDLETLTRVVQEAGFLIERVDYIVQNSFPEELKLDGRETVGIIAHKPTL